MKNAKKNAQFLSIAGMLLLANCVVANAQDFGDFAPVPQGAFVNEITGQRYNNIMAATMSYQATATERMMQTTLMQSMMRDALISSLGKKRIKSGTASTRVTPAPQFSLVAGKRKAEYGAALREFHSKLKESSLVPYDLADGSALAFIMNFEVLSGGAKPTATHLKNLQKDFRTRFLNDALLQGVPEEQRQKTYEALAIHSVLVQKRWRKATAEQEEGVVEAAKVHARSLISTLWNGPADKIVMTATGFADRGEKTIKDGRAKTSFKRIRSEANVEAFANNILQRSPRYSDPESYRKLLDRFDREVEKRNCKTNDLADCNTVAFALLYGAYYPGTVLNQRQFAWVQNEMRKDISGMAKLQSANGSVWQAEYEMLALRAMTRLDEIENVNAALKGGFSGDYAKVEENNMKNIRKTVRSQIISLIKEIFAPRNLDDYELGADGFQRR